MQLVRSMPALCASIAVGFACSSNGPSKSVSGAAGSPVVAEVNGESVTLAELDARIASEIYDARNEALQELVQELVVETEATRRGITPEDLLEQELAGFGAVSDAEIADFFETNKGRMRPGETLENVSPQIRRYLEQERRGRVTTMLRDRAEIVLNLQPPRVQVAATGPSLGPVDAPVTIVEFSDYQCPFCSRAEPVVQQLLERYPTQVRLVYRHLPLESIHPQARGAAVAAVCAEQQDQFWAFHAKLFANQKALDDENLERFAGELGLDIEAFDRCRAGSEAADRVSADLRAGQEAGATGTPAFFVNGIKLSGARPLEDFVEVIERELERRG